jgi:hypothetical protein
MGRREPDLREELLAARERLDRQIEQLASPASRGLGLGGPGLGPPLIDNAALIAELDGVRREIDLRLSELGPDPISG